jgi:hypothetical protein
MEVSVIIPTRDHYVTLARCLKSLKEALERTPIKAEVLVLDGGRESSADVLEDAKIENSSIAAVEPWWAYSKIINEGVKLTKGEIILLLHDDCRVPQDVFAQASTLSEKEILGGVTYTPDGFVEQAGLKAGYNDPTYRPVGFGLPLKDHKFFGKRGATAVPMTCSFIHRDFFNSLEGFDENYRWCMEDVDLCLRAWEAGGSVFVQQDLHVEHVGASTLVHRLPSDSVQNNLLKFGQRWLLDGRIKAVMEKVEASGS